MKLKKMFSSSPATAPPLALLTSRAGAGAAAEAELQYATRKGDIIRKSWWTWKLIWQMENSRIKHECAYCVSQFNAWYPRHLLFVSEQVIPPHGSASQSFADMRPQADGGQWWHWWSFYHYQTHQGPPSTNVKINSQSLEDNFSFGCYLLHLWLPFDYSHFCCPDTAVAIRLIVTTTETRIKTAWISENLPRSVWSAKYCQGWLFRMETRPALR